MPENKNTDKKDIDLKNYDNFDGPSLKQLNFGLWLSEKRKDIRQLLIIILIVISLGLFSYSIYNYVIYLQNNKEQPANISVPQSPRNMVSNLKLGSVQVFNNYSKTDLAVKLINPNDKFMATFEYCFTRGDKNIICDSEFVMPSGQKYVLALGQSLENSTENINFVISGISWKRIDSHEIPDWSNYYNNHLNFVVNDLKVSNITNNTDIKILSFSIKNNTSYSYYEAPLNILFLNGEKLIGVNRYFLENFLSGQEKEIKINWKTKLFNINQTSVKPDINLLDSNVYMPYQGN
jgi:hypothetical protein